MLLDVPRQDSFCTPWGNLELVGPARAGFPGPHDLSRHKSRRRVQDLGQVFLVDGYRTVVVVGRPRLHLVWTDGANPSATANRNLIDVRFEPIAFPVGNPAVEEKA